jgi:hypothetical protein
MRTPLGCGDDSISRTAKRPLEEGSPIIARSHGRDEAAKIAHADGVQAASQHGADTVGLHILPVSSWRHARYRGSPPT